MDMSPQALPCGTFYRLRSPKCSPEGEITRNPLSHNKRWRRGCPSRTLESQPRGGLYVFIPRAGDRFWTFRYMRQGKARELGLGPLHSVSLVEARERARQARQCLLDGGDPVEIRHEASAAAKVERLKTVTFRQAALDFLQTSRIEGFKNDRHRGQWRSSWKPTPSPSSRRRNEP